MITHVAIQHQGVVYSLPAPCRHHHVIHWIYLHIGVPVDNEIQGFLDHDGNFLDREQAWLHALAHGQVKFHFRPGDNWLYSEHVW